MAPRGGLARPRPDQILRHAQIVRNKTTYGIWFATFPRMVLQRLSARHLLPRPSREPNWFNRSPTHRPPFQLHRKRTCGSRTLFNIPTVTSRSGNRYSNFGGTCEANRSRHWSNYLTILPPAAGIYYGSCPSSRVRPPGTAKRTARTGPFVSKCWIGQQPTRILSTFCGKLSRTGPPISISPASLLPCYPGRGRGVHPH